MKRDMQYLEKSNESLKRKREYDCDKVKKYKKEIDHLTEKLNSERGKHANEIENERSSYSSLQRPLS